MEEEKTCIICFVPNPSQDDYVTCPYCNFETCKDCLKRFILEGIGEAYCMNVSCKKYFTRSFLGIVFGLTWITRATKDSYKSFLKEKYLEAQKAKIPEIMTYMKRKEEYEANLKIRNAATARCKELDVALTSYNNLSNKIYNVISRCLKSRKRSDLISEIMGYMESKQHHIRLINYFDVIMDVVKGTVDMDNPTLPDLPLYIRMARQEQELLAKKIIEFVIEVLSKPPPTLVTLLKEFDKIKAEGIKLTNEYLLNKKIISEYRYIQNPWDDAGNKTQKTDGPTYIQGCPSKECRGLIEKGTFTCSICNIKICKKCRVEKMTKSEGKEEEGKPSKSSKKDKHVCKKEDIETVKLINSDSKPCPKCATSIFRISGCFGMDTPVLLYDSSIKMSQDIKIGDVLIGDDGNRRTVMDVCNGIDELYKVTQSNGMEYIVNSKHTLALMDQKNEVVDIMVEDYLKLPKVKRDELYGYKCFSYMKSSITVENIGKGKYFGWMIDGNHKFVFPDLTIACNCDQMFCTNCHIAFDWKTGKICEGVIHNPHYFEFLKSKGLQQNDNGPCRDDQPPHFHDILPRLATPLLKGKEPKNGSFFILFNKTKLSRGINAITELNESIQWMQRKNRNSDVSLYELGVRYLRKEIDENEWSKKIYEQHESIAKNNFIIEIYQSLRMILIESYRKLYTDLGAPIISISSTSALKEYTAKRKAIIYSFEQYLEEIRKYFNDSIIDEYKKTSLKKSSFFVIGPYWDIMSYSEIKCGYVRPIKYGDENDLENTFHYFAREVVPPRNVTRYAPPPRIVEEWESSDDEEYPSPPTHLRRRPHADFFGIEE